MNDLVPDDWSLKTCGELCHVITKGTTPSSVGYSFQESGINFIKVESIDSNGVIDARKFAFISEEANLALKRSIICEGDILITIAGATVGKLAIALNSHLPANTNQALAIVRPNEKKVYGIYLYYWLQADTIKKSIDAIKTVGAQPNLSLAQVGDFLVNHPPLPEQQKIAKILTSVDEVIEKTQAQIDKLKDLKTGMMQELLTNGIDHTEFKDTPVGRIPADWEVKTLDKIISTMDGGVSVNSENKPKSSGQFGILKTSSIAKGKFFPSENKVVLPHEIERLKTPVLADHIVFSRMNTPALVGESGYIPQNHDDLFLPDRLWQIDVKCRKETNVLWLSYVLASNKLKAEISELATGTSNTMKNISKPKLLSIKVASPKFEEQVKVSKSLKSIDTKIDLISSKLEKSKNAKKALMQDLLTGKVRVKADS